MHKVGLVLGGGGVAGSAHLGVMLALEEAGVRFHCMAGTSSGAIVSALYAYGYSIREMIDIVPYITKDYLDYNVLACFKKIIRRKTVFQGFVKGNRLLEFLIDMTKGATMQEITLPVALLAVDLRKAKAVVFTSQDFDEHDSDYDKIGHIRVADAVMASCSIPILFQPVHFENRILVDGGLVDNCPITLARALGADKIIAVDLVAAPLQSSFHSIGSILSRVVTMNLMAQARFRLPLADMTLCPEVGTVGALDFTQTLRCIECGYEYTRRCMDSILEAIAYPKANVRSSELLLR